MDRFEASASYIPPKSSINLHSSMDRFEDLVIVRLENKQKIYIPVWIDLKHDTFVECAEVI